MSHPIRYTKRHCSRLSIPSPWPESRSAVSSPSEPSWSAMTAAWTSWGDARTGTRLVERCAAGQRDDERIASAHSAHPPPHSARQACHRALALRGPDDFGSRTGGVDRSSGRGDRHAIEPRYPGGAGAPGFGSDGPGSHGPGFDDQVPGLSVLPADLIPPLVLPVPDLPSPAEVLPWRASARRRAEGPSGRVASRASPTAPTRPRALDA